MYIAEDKFGIKIDIADAITDQEYFCPVCHSPLLIKDGEINAKHYAHKSGACMDDWNYDMSEWHRRMQSFYNFENREVVLKYNGKTHRADVMINDTVIEFQHSPISAKEFMDRNIFFQNLGKRIAWVFDVTEQFENESLYFSGNDDKLLYTWKNPLRVFSAGYKITDYSKNYAIWLYWSNMDDESLSKVIWTATDEEGKPSLKRFITSNYTIELNKEKSINPEEFFYSKKDYFYNALTELKKHYSYNIKYSGEKGKPKTAYVCPRRPNDFGIKLYSETGCLYCKYCFMAANQKCQDETKWAIYCCYPMQVRKLDGEFEGHPGYECSSANIYEI